MKKLMTAVFAIALTYSANAQAQQSAEGAKAKKSENYVMMYKGKMMKIVDEKPSPMTESVTLDNGAIVATDGSVKLPDGKSIKIKENQKVTMSGKMSMAKKK